LTICVCRLSPVVCGRFWKQIGRVGLLRCWRDVRQLEKARYVSSSLNYLYIKLDDSSDFYALIYIIICLADSWKISLGVLSSSIISVCFVRPTHTLHSLTLYCVACQRSLVLGLGGGMCLLNLLFEVQDMFHATISSSLICH
jgi:hypothetical protein